jgi:thiamine-phosphate pyrophosphorylase
MPSKPQGTGRLKRYASLMSEYPLVAIGGINHANLAEVLKAQIGSIAMVRGIIQADNPEAEIKKYMCLLADHGC